MNTPRLPASVLERISDGRGHDVIVEYSEGAYTWFVDGELVRQSDEEAANAALALVFDGLNKQRRMIQ